MRHSAKLRTFAKHQNILNILKVKVSNCYVQSTVYYVVKKKTLIAARENRFSLRIIYIGHGHRLNWIFRTRAYQGALFSFDWMLTVFFQNFLCSNNSMFNQSINQSIKLTIGLDMFTWMCKFICMKSQNRFCIIKILSSRSIWGRMILK